MLTSSPAMAVKIKVNSTADVIADDGYCTLREAVIAANTDTALWSTEGECPAGYGADKIVLKSGVYMFAIGGPYEDNAQAGDLDILDDLTIAGKGASETIIDGNYIDRVFHVMSNVNVNFYAIHIQNGLVSDYNGGGIYNSGILQITESEVSDNMASASRIIYGGGIYNDGEMTLTNSIVYDNEAYSTDSLSMGGGIYNIGIITTTDSKVYDNKASSINSLSIGGGIFNDIFGSITMIRNKVSGNIAFSTVTTASGGGIYNAGTITIKKSKVSGNVADGNYMTFGGGIYNDMSGTTTVKGTSRISGNNADDGGGVYNNSGAFTKSKRTTIKNNLLDDSWGI
jgi:CSLREA domain-containing protein